MDRNHDPPLLSQETAVVSTEEILYNILIFISLMLVAKLLSTVYKFRLYRKSRKYAVPKRSKLIQKQVTTDLELVHNSVDTVRKPLHAVRIRCMRELTSELLAGQHYAVKRNYLGYALYHHFLISEVGEDWVKLIHYNGEAGVFLKSGSKVFGHVCEERVSFEDWHYFDVPENLFRVKDPSYPEPDNVRTQVVQRARGRIGENRYGITYNNCEHFVRWALTGTPHCQQYDCSNMTDKVVGAMVDELPHIGVRMSMKLCKELLYALTVGVEQLVLQSSARLIQHTASASISGVLSTAAATFGWTAPVEAAFLAFRILDWKRHLSMGTMNKRDYNNAKDKAITGSVFSIAMTTVGAIGGQLVIPYPAVGAVTGSFFGGFVGRILGLVLSGYGIAIKEKYFFGQRFHRTQLWCFRRMHRYLEKWKKKASHVSTLVVERDLRTRLK